MSVALRSSCTWCDKSQSERNHCGPMSRYMRNPQRQKTALINVHRSVREVLINGFFFPMMSQINHSRLKAWAIVAQASLQCPSHLHACALSHIKIPRLREPRSVERGHGSLQLRISARNTLRHCGRSAWRRNIWCFVF